MLRVFLLALAFCAAVLAGPGVAVAQTTGSGTFSGLDHINRIINGTPGITTVALTGGDVSASASGIVNVATRSGLSIPVPTTVTAKVGRAAVALGAARIGLRFLPWIGTAVTVAEIANEVASSGYTICPAPAFFCKANVDSQTGWYWSDSIYGYYSFSEQDVCNHYYIRNNQPQIVSVGPPVLNGNTYSCLISVSGGAPQQGQSFSRTACPPAPSMGPPNSGCNGGVSTAGNTVSQPVPASIPDLQAQEDAKFQANAALAKKLYDYEQSVAGMNPDLANPIETAAATLTMNAPAVTTAVRTVSTEQVPNADGTTSTVTVKEQTTVTPTMAAGATVASPGITYPSVTTTTTTTTNNSTNVTTTDTTTNNYTGNASDTPLPIKFPTDYNREATQKQIEADLNTDNAQSLPDQNGIVNSAKTDSDTNLQGMRDDAVNAHDTDQNRFFNFLWSPPTGTCAPYVLKVGAFTGSADFCSYVSLIQECLGWLMALGTAFSVWATVVKGENNG